MANVKPVKGVPGLYQDLDSLIYIWRERVKGQDYWRSTGTTSIMAAKEILKGYRADATGAPVKKSLRHSMDEVFDIAMAIKAARSGKTATAAKTQIEGHLRPWFRANCEYLDEFERNAEEVWAKYRTDQATATPGRKLKHDREHLLFAIKRAKDKGWITRVITKTDLHLNESTESIGRALEDDEVNRLLTAAKGNETLFLQIRMAVLMGMRLREILHLSWAEIEWKTNEVVLGGVRVKTRRGRRVPIHVSLMAELKTRRRAGEGDYVFPARLTSVSGAPTNWKRPQDDNSKPFERARAEAGSDARFHDLRHTYMTNALAEGLQPADVSKITGASLKVVLSIYHHVRGDVRERARNLFCGKFVGSDE